MSPSSSPFGAVIEEHLELKRRNRHLDSALPLESFSVEDPFQNHPLFKSEADARREEADTGEHPAVALEIPADTASMPAVERPDDGQPLGWMETGTAGEFSWE